MSESNKFLKSLIDSIREQIAVINSFGDIIYVNRSWVEFAKQNECRSIDNWLGLNYLKVCKTAADMGDEFGMRAVKGLESMLSGESDSLYFEYPCHSPYEKRWFMMSTTRMDIDGDYFVVSHSDITKRKLAEEKVLQLAKLDGLTGIANRRSFDEFITEEWSRCQRLNLPISLAMIDIDYFKLLNDTYGHQYGDKCLKKVASVISKYGNRPGDIVARYGGEEFVIVLGNTLHEHALKLINELSNEIQNLNIHNSKSKTSKILTVSIGLATLVPSQYSHSEEILNKADELLYEAKEGGRNRIISQVF